MEAGDSQQRHKEGSEPGGWHQERGAAPGKGAGVEIQWILHLRLAKCQTLDGTLNAADETVRDSLGGRRDKGSGTSGPLRFRQRRKTPWTRL